MSNSFAFEIQWSALDERYALTSPDGQIIFFAAPTGRVVSMPRAAWLALREVLAVLSSDPSVDQASAADRPDPASGRPADPGPALKIGPANRGKPWTEADEEELRAYFVEGITPSEIARALGRTRGSVVARLVRLGLVAESEAGLRYPVARPAVPQRSVEPALERVVEAAGA